MLALAHFLQKILAGFPSPAADYTESTLDLNEYLVNHKAASLFTVDGVSMTGAYIDDGDKVLVDRSIDPKHRHIVIAAVDGQYTIKRLYKRKGVIGLRLNFPRELKRCVYFGNICTAIYSKNSKYNSLSANYCDSLASEV